MMDPPAGHSYGSVNLSADAHAMLGDIHHHHYAKEHPQKGKYNILYQSLSFQGMHSRLRNVEMALPHTCVWLRSHPLFLSWKDVSQVAEHHGLLWIKGKPGSGKSTIIKDTLEWARRKWPDHFILSYFFNARAPTELEKSSLGLYRSLTHQLLSLHDALRSPFVEEFSTKERDGKIESWTETELQNYILKMLRAGHLPRLNIFVDALDEGNYNDVWHMITFFEKAAEVSILTGSTFRLCLSSRHYPQINIEKGLTIILENQLGHKHDIKLYIEKALPGMGTDLMNEIRNSLLRKAEGVFLWVVLTISLLRPLHSRRRVEEMQRQLEILPTGLYDLFSAIIAKDTGDLHDCITLLQWMLVRKRMLSAHELYLGIQCRDPSLDTDLNEQAEDLSTVSDRIVDCSRGFVELVEESDLGVQFIHESVRQFLNSINEESGQSQHSPPSVFDFSAETCNLVVTEGCLRYLLRLCRGPQLTEQIFVEYPLARYAAKYWWRHMQTTNASKNHRAVSLAQELLTGSVQNLFRWVQMYDIDCHRDYPDLGLEADTLPQPLYYIASIGRLELFSPELLSIADFKAQEGRYGSALQVASAHNYKDVAQLLLDRGADVNCEGGAYGSALQVATANNYKEVVELLLDGGADVNGQGGYHGGVLHTASAYGRKEVAELLLDRGADVNAGGNRSSALQIATIHGHKEVVRLLLERGADVNAQRGNRSNALYAASQNGNTEISKILLDMGADVNTQGGDYGNALQVAIHYGQANVIQMLLDYGARIDAPGTKFPDALTAARAANQPGIVSLLVKHANQRSLLTSDMLYSQIAHGW